MYIHICTFRTYALLEVEYVERIGLECIDMVSYLQHADN